MKTFLTASFVYQYETNNISNYEYNKGRFSKSDDKVESKKRDFKREHGLNVISDSEITIKIFTKLHARGTCIKLNIGNKTQDYAKIKINDEWKFIKIINMIRVEYIDKVSIYITFHYVWRKCLSKKLEYCIKSTVHARYPLKKWIGYR